MCIAMVHAVIMVSNIHYIGMLYILVRKMECTIKHSSSISELASSVMDTVLHPTAMTCHNWMSKLATNLLIGWLFFLCAGEQGPKSTALAAGAADGRPTAWWGILHWVWVSVGVTIPFSGAMADHSLCDSLVAGGCTHCKVL